MCSDKNCQETKHMQPVKPAMDMQSILRPAKLQSSYKKKDQVKFIQVSMKDDLKSQSLMCSDKHCQENQNINMWSVKSQMDMQSKEPAMQSSFKKKHVPLCRDKNCQSTRCYKKYEDTKYDKNFQSMWPKKPSEL